MPAERMGMRDAREILRLKASSVSTHEIARRLGLVRSTVRETLKRTQIAGLVWPLPEGMNDEALEAALYAISLSDFGHQAGMRPQRIGTSSRFPFLSRRISACASKSVVIHFEQRGSRLSRGRRDARERASHGRARKSAHHQALRSDRR
jgi:hypothetical protein